MHEAAIFLLIIPLAILMLAILIGSLVWTYQDALQPADLAGLSSRNQIGLIGQRLIDGKRQRDIYFVQPPRRILTERLFQRCKPATFENHFQCSMIKTVG